MGKGCPSLRGLTAAVQPLQKPLLSAMKPEVTPDPLPRGSPSAREESPAGKSGGGEGESGRARGWGGEGRAWSRAGRRAQHPWLPYPTSVACRGPKPWPLGLRGAEQGADPEAERARVGARWLPRPSHLPLRLRPLTLSPGPRASERASERSKKQNKTNSCRLPVVQLGP